MVLVVNPAAEPNRLQMVTHIWPWLNSPDHQTIDMNVFETLVGRWVRVGMG